MYGETPLHLSAENGHFDIVKLFLDDGRINAMDINQYCVTGLHYAAMGGYKNVIKLVLNDPRTDHMDIQFQRKYLQNLFRLDI
jgi:ankyrin repeat protein